jgi:tetratricopeptide (TPR) repeat protein
MGSPPPPEKPADRPDDKIDREHLDDLIELALEQRKQKDAAGERFLDASTAEAIASEVGISPEEFAAARKALQARQSRLTRTAKWATAAGLVIAGGLWLATPGMPKAPPPDYPATVDKTDLALKLRVEGDNLRKQKKQYRDALSRYRQAVRLTPNDTNAWNDLGIGFKHAGDPVKAEAAYRKAIAVGGEALDACYAYYNLANLIDEGPRRAEAIPLYLEAIRRKPAASDYHNNLGVLYERLGRYDDAIRCYRQSFKVNPAYKRGQNNLRLLREALAKQQLTVISP